MGMLTTLLKEKHSYNEKGQLAIDVFNIYISIMERIEHLISHPNEINSIGGLESMTAKARDIFACALRICGVKYVDMGKYYGLTPTRAAQIAEKGKRRCLMYYKEIIVDAEDFIRIFNNRGRVYLPFTTEEYIKEQERKLQEMKEKIQEIKISFKGNQ